MPWPPPRALIHRHRLLWRCAATILTVRRGAPETGTDQRSVGRRSIRYIVTRLFVRHALTNLDVFPTPPLMLLTASMVPCSSNDKAQRRGLSASAAASRWPIRRLALKI